ncbi:hypothetical protein D3218_13440 [Aureimonas flava]|uniref:Uncharacterized protein n=1 Tax=Aureimonas flava TaxID=2320271 RepID=A0A3A1WLN2_9HYPH|nr:hypothetical protein [Aureimonas flava]RIY00277.1 hypothetical protein D3218_13440 [Aureimonas flava]
MTRTAGRLAIAFLLAVLATAIPASFIQTNINLSNLADLGAPISPLVRTLTTLQDIVFFGPVMAAITAAAFLPAFVAAWPMSRALPYARLPIHALAGAVSLWTAFEVMGFVSPMPTFVAAARTPEGLLALSLTGLIGGALFAYVAGQRTRPAMA